MHKRYWLIIGLIQAFGFINAQSIESQVDSLKELKSEAQKEVFRLESQIQKLEQKKLSELRLDKYREGVAIHCKVPTKIYQKRGTWSTILDTVPAGYTLLAYDYQSNYYLVEYDTLLGFVFTLDVETMDRKTQRTQKEKRVQEERQRRAAEEGRRRQRLIDKYGTDKGLRIFSGKIWLGMSKEMVEESWGKPKDVNRTVGSWGVHEQWVYYDAYLYVRNGVLTSWQD